MIPVSDDNLPSCFFEPFEKDTKKSPLLKRTRRNIGNLVPVHAFPLSRAGATPSPQLNPTFFKFLRARDATSVFIKEEKG
jgi:hypothetical protein